MQSPVILKPFCMKAKTPRCIWVNGTTNGIMPCYYIGDDEQGVVRSMTGTVMGTRWGGIFEAEKNVGGLIQMIPCLSFYKRVVKSHSIEYIEVYWFDRLQFGTKTNPKQVLTRIGIQFSIFNKANTQAAQSVLDGLAIVSGMTLPVQRVQGYEAIHKLLATNKYRSWGFPNSNLGITEIAGSLTYDTKSYEWVRQPKGILSQVYRNNFGTELYAIPGIPESFHLNWKEAVKNA